MSLQHLENFKCCIWQQWCHEKSPTRQALTHWVAWASLSSKHFNLVVWLQSDGFEWECLSLSVCAPVSRPLAAVSVWKQRCWRSLWSGDFIPIRCFESLYFTFPVSIVRAECFLENHILRNGSSRVQLERNSQHFWLSVLRFLLDPDEQRQML